MEDLALTSKWQPDPKFWLDRSVFISGASGFLGSHLTKIVVELGANVIALVRDRVPPTPVSGSWLQEVTIVSGDIVDQALVERVLGEYEVRTVLHLAAQTLVGVANSNPRSTFDSNIRGTWSLLEAIRHTPGVEEIVVASSDKAYGSQPSLPYNEGMALLASNPYDVSKACADMISLSYHKVFSLPVSVTRCGNFFGPGDINWNRLVPGTIRSLLRGDRPQIRSDGTPIRDYLYVEDGALAYLKLAERMARDPYTVGQAFNFSTESQMTALELAQAIALSVGRPDLPPQVLNVATHEIPHQYLSAEKARQLLDWGPNYLLDDALAVTIEWYRKFLALGETVPE